MKRFPHFGWHAAAACLVCTAAFAQAQNEPARSPDRKTVSEAGKSAPAPKGRSAKGTVRSSAPDPLEPDVSMVDPLARAQAVIPECIIKPVMTDAEIDVCKRTAKR